MLDDSALVHQGDVVGQLEGFFGVVGDQNGGDVEAADVRQRLLTQALAQANSTANLLKQLLAALRLPDERGERPQFRGPRGSYAPKGSGKAPGKVSSLDRARAAKSG